MSRTELDREDLLGEATALVERVEVVVADWPRVVVGFRRDGAASVFFGADPVYQFNADGALRRGYCDGRLIKADGGRLVSLERRRQANVVELVREEWSEERAAAWLDDASQRLTSLYKRLLEGGFQTTGQVPADADVLGRVLRWLPSLPQPLRVAQRPNTAG